MTTTSGKTAVAGVVFNAKKGYYEIVASVQAKNVEPVNVKSPHRFEPGHKPLNKGQKRVIVNDDTGRVFVVVGHHPRLYTGERQAFVPPALYQKVTGAGYLGYQPSKKEGKQFGIGA